MRSTPSSVYLVLEVLERAGQDLEWWDCLASPPGNLRDRAGVPGQDGDRAPGVHAHLWYQASQLFQVGQTTYKNVFNLVNAGNGLWGGGACRR